ncbi:GP88 family protein [Posidoniimonas corsicana]|uniref:GP88 family protein n=1 Tax=Posidoniimonas corsicana TaxID=1938618 RepID=UPI0011B6AAAB|nr:hypothetical protein [Posidoniimonas corsicana]
MSASYGSVDPPEKLVSRDAWVAWCFLDNWGNRDEFAPGPYLNACFAREVEGYDGIAIDINENDSLVAIRLTDCRDAETGEVESWAQEVLDEFGSYAYSSTNGTSVMIVCEGKLPDGCPNNFSEVGESGNWVIFDYLRRIPVTGVNVSCRANGEMKVMDDVRRPGRGRPVARKEGPMMLLRTNAKLAKAGPDRYLLAGLTIAPHRLSGHEVCPASTVGCRAACNLWFSGQRVLPAARNRARLDTRWLHEDRTGFLAQLDRDLAAHARRAERLGLRPLVRLNVASDLDWSETIARWPGIRFYDYTKVRSRFRAYLDGRLPENYTLTFSASESSHPATLASFLRRGGNVAAVFAVDYHPACGRIGAAAFG